MNMIMTEVASRSHLFSAVKIYSNSHQFVHGVEHSLDPPPQPTLHLPTGYGRKSVALASSVWSGFLSIGLLLFFIYFSFAC